MSPIITELSPPQTAEGLILDPDGSSPLDLGNAGSLQLSAFTFAPAPKLPQWASNGDADGQALVRNPFHDNRSGTFQVRAMDGTMDQAINAIKLLEDKLQEACVQGAGGGDGLACLWTPSHASTGLTFFMLFAQITDMPVTVDDGWFAQHPIVTVAFTAKPFLYGDEVSAGSVTSSNPLVTIEIDSVPGDVSAEARLVITDESTQARRWCEWGLEQFYYDASSPAPLFIDSGSLITSGFAGAGTAISGAFGGSAIAASLLSQPTAVCSTGAQPHVGTYRVKGRVWTASTAQYWQLTWQEGDGPFASNTPQQPLAGSAFTELDFGLVTILPPVEAGTQMWTGRFEAYTTTVGGEIGALDYIELFPVDEGYGRLEATYAYQAGAITAHDEFTGGTDGSALNGRTAPAGGSWATSGATTDFVFVNDGSPGTPPTTIARSTTSDSGYRFAILGSTSDTNVEVGADTFFAVGSSLDLYNHALVARWTDSSNHLRLRRSTIQQPTGQSSEILTLEHLVAGTVTALATANTGSTLVAAATWLRLRLVAFASGRALGWLLDANGNTLLQVDALTSVLATGGTLATGKFGVADLNSTTGAVTRYFDNVYVAAPASENLIINPGQSLEVRSDANLRASTDGSAYGDIPSRGSRLFVPQAGDAGRATRIAVRATREDVITSASRNDGDSITVEAWVTPRYLAVPR